MGCEEEREREGGETDEVEWPSSFFRRKGRPFLDKILESSTEKREGFDLFGGSEAVVLKSEGLRKISSVPTEAKTRRSRTRRRRLTSVLLGTYLPFRYFL